MSAKRTSPPAKPQAPTLPLDRIIIGRRHRRDLGDIAGLAASIRDIGLLNPITVDENGRLLAGARRLAACKLLGLEKVEVRIVRCADEA
jgi:ParB family chromosome partitioning protein